MNLYFENPSDIQPFLRSLSEQKVTGEAIFRSGEDSAKVYLLKGRILWAFASGQKESFQSILIRENKLTKENLLDGIKEARKLGRRNLDDILEVLGIKDAPTRRAIVSRHTSSALDVVFGFRACAAQFLAAGPVAEAGGPGSTEIITTGFNLDELLRASADTKTIAVVGTSPASQVSSYRPELTHEAVDSPAAVLERFRLEVQGFLACIVIDCATSMPIAVLSDAPDFDVDVVSAYYRDIARSADAAMQVVGKASRSAAPLEEILVTSSEDYVLLKSLNAGSQLVYLLTDRSGNPGMARLVVRRYAESLEGFLK